MQIIQTKQQKEIDIERNRINAERQAARDIAEQAEHAKLEAQVLKEIHHGRLH
jgi:hypothetical protein